MGNNNFNETTKMIKYIDYGFTLILVVKVNSVTSPFDWMGNSERNRGKSGFRLLIKS